MKVEHSSPALWKSVTKGLDLHYTKATKNLAPELVEIGRKVAFRFCAVVEIEVCFR